MIQSITSGTGAQVLMQHGNLLSDTFLFQHVPVHFGNSSAKAMRVTLAARHHVFFPFTEPLLPLEVRRSRPRGGGLFSFWTSEQFDMMSIGLGVLAPNDPKYVRAVCLRAYFQNALNGSYERNKDDTGCSTNIATPRMCATSKRTERLNTMMFAKYTKFFVESPQGLNLLRKVLDLEHQIQLLHSGAAQRHPPSVFIFCFDFLFFWFLSFF